MRTESAESKKENARGNRLNMEKKYGRMGTVCKLRTLCAEARADARERRR